MNRDQHVGRNITMLSNQIRRHIDSFRKTAGLSGSQGMVLHYIISECEQRELFQKDIEENFNLRRSSATGLLQAMERNDLIRRVSVTQDARLKKIMITEKARGLTLKIEENLEDLEHILANNLTDEEIATFLAISGKMLHNFE